MSVENMGNGYVKVGVKQEDLEASIAGLRQLKPILQAQVTRGNGNKLAQLDFVKRQAKEAGYNIKFVPLSRPQIEGMRLRTILKDECIKTKEAREYIGKYINIIGIEEI